MSVIALIPAAGMGRRMGAGMNKQYLQLRGMPILARTVAVFQQASCINRVLLIIPDDEIPYCRESVVNAYRFDKVERIVPGGTERQHSVYNGLSALQCGEDDIILIHDGVRPFVTEDTLQRSIAALDSADGAVVAVPAKDTIKIVSDGAIQSTPPRETLWLAQTPQAFRYSVIKEAHDLAHAAGYLGTDDASLLERLGKKVAIVPGDYRNIKITTPEDLVLAEAFLS